MSSSEDVRQSVREHPRKLQDVATLCKAISAHSGVFNLAGPLFESFSELRAVFPEQKDESEGGDEYDEDEYEDDDEYEDEEADGDEGEGKEEKEEEEEEKSQGVDDDDGMWCSLGNNNNKKERLTSLLWHATPPYAPPTPLLPPLLCIQSTVTKLLKKRERGQRPREVPTTCACFPSRELLSARQTNGSSRKRTRRGSRYSWTSKFKTLSTRSVASAATCESFLMADGVTACFPLVHFPH